MNLKEKIAQKQAELLALKEKILKGDAEAIKASEAIVTELEEMEDILAKAEAAERKMKEMGGKQQDAEDDVVPAKTLGENFGKALKNAGIAAGKRFSVSAPEFKANTDVLTVPEGALPAVTTYDYNVVEAARAALVIRNLFSQETISGAALTYFVEGAVEGAPAVTAEGAAKPQISFAEPTAVTVALDKIAAFIKESDEYISDVPFLASAINGRLLYQLYLAEQTYLVTRLLNTSGIQVADIAAGNSATFIADTILKAIADVDSESGFPADAIVIDPQVYLQLKTGKDANGQYYGGGYFGNGDNRGIWDLETVRTSAASGHIIVGAYKVGGSVVSKGGVAVDATNSDADDFTHNRMTIRAEERMALAVRRPAAFVDIRISTYTKSATGAKAAAGVTYYTQSGSAGAYVYTPVPASEITVGTTDVSGYYTRS